MSTKLLIANRGEIAVRIIRAAADLGIPSVAIYAEDDARALHVRLADEAHPLERTGVAAYLDGPGILAVARKTGAGWLHPGYGFLAENAAFARACADVGIRFVGPRPEILELFGDKVRARAAAAAAGLPVLRASPGPCTVEEAKAFYADLPGGAMVIKAVAGGGGRGMRAVFSHDEIEPAYGRCRSEAGAAFGDDAVYVEELMPRARHIEVQIIGDRAGATSHLWERDCTVQRRHQKLIEIAPSPVLAAALRRRLVDAALALAGAVRYDNVGTFEFLVDAGAGADARFAFIEANPRLQVEHTVTEETTGVDLVAIQLALTEGRSLADLGLTRDAVPVPRGIAIQARVNMETMTPDGGALPAGGELTVFEPPTGPGIRIDTFGYAGYATNPRFDSLLAKVIAVQPSGDFPAAAARLHRALGEFRIEGTPTNIGFLRSVLRHPDLVAGTTYTRFVDDHAAALIEAAEHHRPRVAESFAEPPARAGAKVDASDPLAVLRYGRSAGRAAAEATAPAAPVDGTVALAAALQGTVVSVDVAPGDSVRAGDTVLVMEAMKMEHEVRAETSGVVRRIVVVVGDAIPRGQPLVYIAPAPVEAGREAVTEAIDLDAIRPDLREVLDRHARTLDAARPHAVARRRHTGQRTARENVDDLFDPGTFVEYAPLVLAAQRQRRSVEDLIARSPADGLITGIGAVNGAHFDDPAARCAVMAYDYTVFAGTQGHQNHRKTDRMIGIAADGRLPMVLFAEGGGGRPGDTDLFAGHGATQTFAHFAKLSALVPMVGITSGRCFAGNASLLGCCDVIIATAGANIGMGGPAMIEGGGLGVFAPEEIGPMEVQRPNGVVDVAVVDEAEAVAVAKRYLSYFQGSVREWDAPDQRLMRRIVPENRLRVYDVRQVIDTLADSGSVLELRRDFGLGMVTCLARVEGRPLGIVANNPMHLGGAIDADGSDKGARFMQLCDAFDLPLLFLCDTPGIMVGPEIEKTALVRKSSRMFLVGANLGVPFFTIILRKSYGLGAIAMAGGSFKTPYFAVAWPTGEFGGMGLEGYVKLGYRDELAAIDDPAARMQAYEALVANQYEVGKALSNASHFGIDDTIDPADSRRWVASLLRSVRGADRPPGKKRPMIDGW